jgi:hypothetical protein
VNCLAFSADESCILAGLWDGTIKVFRVANEHNKLDFKEGMNEELFVLFCLRLFFFFTCPSCVILVD